MRNHYVTASKIIPLLNYLKNKIQLSRLNLKTPTAISLVNSLNESVSARFGQIESNSIMATSTILDPRFKKIHFNQAITYSNAINRIARWMKDMDHETIFNVVSDESHLEICENTDDDLWSFHDNLIKAKNFRTEPPRDEIPTDLKHYLNQPLLDRKADPIKYWLQYERIYPTLSSIAKKYLPIMATSVPSERVFSRAGNILTDHRNSLSSEHLQQLLFLNSLSMKE